MEGKKKLLFCKKCGNAELFYKKEKCEGFYDYIVDSKAESIEELNESMYDSIITKIRSKFYFCYECDSRVCEIEDFGKE